MAEGEEVAPGEAASRVVAPEDPVGEASEAALRRALRYLTHRPRSRAEMERHLLRGGHDEGAVASAIARCEALGYVDDRAFAVSWTLDRIRLKPRGIARLRQELRKKGVPEADAEAGIRRAFDEEGITERELAERAARKKWRIRRSDDPLTIRRRLAAYLERRGFPSHEAREVIDRLLIDLER